MCKTLFVEFLLCTGWVLTAHQNRDVHHSFILTLFLDGGPVCKQRNSVSLIHGNSDAQLHGIKDISKQSGSGLLHECEGKQC